MESSNISPQIIETGQIRKIWDDHVKIWMMILYYHLHVASPLQWLEPTLLSREFGKDVNYALDQE